MTDVELIVPRAGTRRWQVELIAALRQDGHAVRVVRGSHADSWPSPLDLLLKAERLASRNRARLHDPVEIAEATTGTSAAGSLVIDLAGEGRGLCVRFDGHWSAAKAVAALVAGRLPEITIAGADGICVDARPMVDSRVFAGKGLEDVLARVITMLRAIAIEPARLDATAPRLPSFRDAKVEMPAAGALAGAIARVHTPRLMRELVRRSRYQQAHWRVGYRFHSEPGVADLGGLGGAAWSELPDDGARYYADPFPFEHEARHFLFVEEFPHATGKGIISVSTFDAAGRPTTPRPVMDQPFHLSYPQVFSAGGDIYMLPEGGAGGELVLYRATDFPGGWVPDCVLVPGRELYDATLLEHGGRFWLLAAERDGRGSSADTMVAFHAPTLKGPWTPHRANPIAIDLAGAAFVQVGRRLVRPVQDGTLGYGGGLGLSDLTRLDEEEVRFSRPVPILGARQWPHPRIHTLNRAGRLEVIDGIAETRRGARAA